MWYGIIHLEKLLEGEHEAVVVLLCGLTYGILKILVDQQTIVLQKVAK